MVLGNYVAQKEKEKTVDEGMDVTINCSYTSTKHVLIWYIQRTSGTLQFLLHDESKENDLDEKFKKRFSAKHDSAEKTFPLTIKKSRWSDSGTYYCALEHSTI
ncbi:hypothetical protein GDO86_001632 [Hymenochirus boettgeri]|uniref:Ig-like domain-containing protein n=1 Tax=Hymenochirus boettgeri TaxID=247094 RepID=A0A8T2KGG7_9PIPI|nr:hypothetical protein GDO86_001632 [Hymenochirus boettgeri]